MISAHRVSTQIPLRSLRRESCFEDLATAIREAAAGEPIDYYDSPGNWGDSLINAGTDDFLESHNIQTVRHGRQHIKRADRRATLRRLAIIGGGGGWNNNWNSSASFAQEASRAYRAVIVMPSSFDPSLVPRFPKKNVTLFSRAAGASLDAAGKFCHDMAFHLRGQGEGATKLGHPLISLRRDKERNAQSVDPDRNWDISLLGNATTSHQGFIDLVARFDRIYTDRLHVAIAGSMLGSEVRLFEGNYDKNSGVFEASLKDFYPKTLQAHWETFDWSRVFGASRIGKPGYGG